MKYFITRWSLTQGILERECKGPEHGWITDGIFSYRIGVDAFPDLDMAKLDFTQRTVARIAVLKKQIDKLRKRIK